MGNTGLWGMKWLGRRLAALAEGREDGSAMVEFVVASGVIGLLTAAMTTGIITLSKVGGDAEARSTAVAVAHYQLEQVARLPYADDPAAYQAAVPADVTYSGKTYQAPVSAAPLSEGNAQRITVGVSYRGNLMLALDDIKINRNAPTPSP